MSDKKKCPKVFHLFAPQMIYDKMNALDMNSRCWFFFSHSTSNTCRVPKLIKIQITCVYQLDLAWHNHITKVISRAEKRSHNSFNCAANIIKSFFCCCKHRAERDKSESQLFFAERTQQNAFVMPFFFVLIQFSSSRTATYYLLLNIDYRVRDKRM